MAEDLRSYVDLACEASGCLERSLVFTAERGKEPPCRVCGGSVVAKWGWYGPAYHQSKEK